MKIQVCLRELKHVQAARQTEVKHFSTMLVNAKEMSSVKKST